MSSIHRMKLGDAAGKAPSLPLVQESPGCSSLSVEASGGSNGSIGRGHIIQRSPLGRSVVTALEAEMDQVQPEIRSMLRNEPIRNAQCPEMSLLLILPTSDRCYHFLPCIPCLCMCYYSVTN